MYKRFDLQQLQNIQNKLLPRTKQVMKQERIPLFKDFLKTIFKEGDEVVYFEAGGPLMRFIKKPDHVMIIDEVDKLECVGDEQVITKFHTLLKDDKKLSQATKNSESIFGMLQKEFEGGVYDTIDGKPYLVYDIETTFETNDMKTQKFVMAYFVRSDDKSYRYVAENSLEKFVRMLLDFDGRIIGYNHIFFDNPVVIHNTGKDEGALKILQQKSLDVFLFLWNLTGKRLSLGKAGAALVGFGKTLESGAEGSNLLALYKKTGDEDALKKVKLYCKNDVRLTLYLMLYLLKYKQIFLEGEEVSFDHQQFMQLAQDENVAKEEGLSLDAGLF